MNSFMELKIKRKVQRNVISQAVVNSKCLLEIAGVLNNPYWSE